MAMGIPRRSAAEAKMTMATSTVDRTIPWCPSFHWLLPVLPLLCLHWMFQNSMHAATNNKVLPTWWVYAKFLQKKKKKIQPMPLLTLSMMMMTAAPPWQQHCPQPHWQGRQLPYPTSWSLLQLLQISSTWSDATTKHLCKQTTRCPHQLTYNQCLLHSLWKWLR